MKSLPVMLPASGRGVAASGTPSDRRAVGVALVVGLAGVLVVAAYLPQVVRLDPAPLLLFLALVLAARARTLPVFGSSAFAVSVVPVLAAGMVLGPPGAAVAGLVSGVAHAVLRHLVWYKALFNTGNYVLAGTAASLVFHTFGLALEPGNLPPLLALSAVVGLTHYLHTFVVAAGIAAERRTSYLGAWREQFAWLWPQYAVLGVMAMLLAVAYASLGVAGAAAFVAPPAMMYFVAKQYVDRTADSVRQLRELNAELQEEIRHRAAAEEENARLTREAARTAALEEMNRLKSRFISVASHELRTPLTAIVGYTELMLADTPPDDPRQPMVAATNESAQHLIGLVANMLDASRIEIGKLAVNPVDVDLTAFVPAVLENFATASPRHRLSAVVADDASHAKADPMRLRQILLNLVGNAIKYSPEGGPVEVRTRAAGPDRVEILVTDEGLGIPAEQQTHIFDPYQRVDDPIHKRIEGTGLGLFIVRSLAELHGGSVRVESEVGRGSTFVVTLPA